MWAGFPKFGRSPPRGRGHLTRVLLTVFEPTGSGGVIGDAASKGAMAVHSAAAMAI